MCVASHRNRNFVFLTVFQHFLNHFSWYPRGIRQVLTDRYLPPERFLSLCFLASCSIIRRISSVIRMSNNVNQRILHCCKVCRRDYLFRPLAFITRSMNACKLQYPSGKVCSPEGQPLPFHSPIFSSTPMNSLAVHFTRYDMQILEIGLMTGSRHLRCMFESVQMPPVLSLSPSVPSTRIVLYACPLTMVCACYLKLFFISLSSCLLFVCVLTEAHSFLIFL